MITYYCNVTVPATFRILVESVSELTEDAVNQLAINKFQEREAYEGNIWDYSALGLRSVIVDQFETPE